MITTKDTKLNKTRVAVLGDIYKKYSSSVSVEMFNTYMEDLSLPTISYQELTNMINYLSKAPVDDPLFILYNNIKSDRMSLKDVTNNKQPETYEIHTEMGDVLNLTGVQLDKINAVKKEYIKKNGNIPWSKIRKNFKNKGIDFTISPELIKVLEAREKQVHKTPKVTRTDTQEVVDQTFSNEVSKLSYHTRQLQNEKRELGKQRRELNDDLIWRNKLISAIPKTIAIPPVPEIKAIPRSKEGNQLVVGLSDLHTGLKTSEYDSGVAYNRLTTYAAIISQYCKSNKVEQIYVVGLGDYIEGAYLHATQLHEIEFGLGEQVTKAMELLIHFFTTLTKEVKLPISWVGISGNHDRSNEANKKDNLLGDSVVDILNALIKEKAPELGITYIEPQTKVRHLLKINNANIALIHGDLDKLQNKDIIAKLTSYFNDRVDSIMGGHLHSFWMNNYGYNQFVVQSSSLFDGNSYSDGLGVTSSPGQIFLSITNDTSKITPHFVTF